MDDDANGNVDVVETDGVSISLEEKEQQELMLLKGGIV